MRGRPLRSENAAASAPIIVVQVSRAERTRFVDAFRGRATCEFVDTLDQVIPALDRAAGRVGAVIMSATGDGGSCAGSLVRRLVARTPRLPVIAYCDAGIAQSGQIRTLASAGVHEYLFRGIDDVGVALRSVVAAATYECAADAVLRVLTPLLPPSLHQFVEICTSRPEEVQSVGEAARILGVNRKTLVNYCARAGTITPVELLGWCRLLLSAELLHATGKTIEAVALDLEWASAASLRNMMKRYTGRRPTEITAGGGLDYAAAILATRLAAVASAPHLAAPDRTIVAV